MADSTAILVLGMHRSGTSAAAGWLQALGVNLGPYLMAEDPTQPKGYFEHPEIVGIHDDLMAAFDSSWDDPRPLPEGWERDSRVRSFRAQLSDIVRRDLMIQPVWSAKDPRLCRLLPLWLPMLGELDVPVRAICVLRHPAEVAESLALRNGFSAEKSGLLWLRYVLEAERNSRSVPRVTLRYADLLRDWRAESHRVAQALGIVWPKSYDQAAAPVTEFLEQGLRHHEGTYFDRFPLPLRKWIVSAYRALKPRNSTSEDGQAILDGVQRELAPYDSYVAACWLERVRNIGFENVQTRAALTQLQAQLIQSQADTADARAALAQAEREFSRAQSEIAAARSELVAVRMDQSREIATTRAELKHTQEELTAVRAASTQMSVQLAEVRTDLAEVQTDLVQARTDLAQARCELERTRAESQRALHELETVFRSRYWRFTRPWRRLDTYLRNGRHRRRERKRRAEISE